ncbi:hypothetical protein [Bacillus coahuilensis]|uniref:hypothetical protein n=1 Tax=Bacillus coahuilensis TaxID=408580 RepID=UPI00030885DC|nr:hypothetical protein [Bacillus coahuilensis]
MKAHLKEIEKELITSKMINETGLPTPKVFGVEEYRGRTGIIYQYIEGPSLFVANYSPMDMLDLLLKLQDSIHKIAAHHFPSLKDRLMQKIMAVFSLTLEEKTKNGLKSFNNFQMETHFVMEISIPLM